MDTLVAPQSIRAWWSCITTFLSCMSTSWTIAAESGVPVLHRWWLSIHAFWLLKMTLNFSKIRWGQTSSRVTISACTPNFFIPGPIWSNFPHSARYYVGDTRYFLADCRTMIDAWCVDAHRWHLCLWLCHLGGWVNLVCLPWRTCAIGRFREYHGWIVRISHWLYIIHSPPLLSIATEIDLFCLCLMT